MNLKLLAVVVSSFMTGAAAAYVAIGQPATVTVKTTGKALVGGPFTMIDHTGKTVTEKDFAGQFLLVFFGFTQCPDVCPATLQVATEALGKLGLQAGKIRPLFVSVDPDRDTPDVLKSYLENFDPRLTGLTGTREQVRAMAKTYRIYYAKVTDPETDGGYTVDHSAFMYLMSPGGRYITHYPFGIQGDALAQRLRRALAGG